MVVPGVADVAVTLSLTVAMIWLVGALLIKAADRLDMRKSPLAASARPRRPVNDNTLRR